jgi:UPF0042 nucleotide-binding protein
LIDRYVETLGVILDGYGRERHPRMNVAVGCTGGRHRSVAVAEELAARLAPRGRVRVFHRDMGRG